MSEKRNDPVLETLSPADRARFLNMVKKGISRRDFMHYMMAAGATAAASSTLFTGLRCLGRHAQARWPRGIRR